MKSKLLKKLENDVSSSSHIEDIDYFLDESIKEAEEIIDNKDVSEVIKFDIAYFRFLLYVKQDGIIEESMQKLYDNALKIVDKAKYKEDETTTGENRSRLVLVGQRESKWY